MVTTIQISNELKEKLIQRKINNRDTFEDIISDLIEDSMEISEQTKKNISEAEKEIKSGKVYTHEQVKKEPCLNV
ncbi:MAG: hypothetical protein ACOC1P_05525 [Minisyncoccales bacterium]